MSDALTVLNLQFLMHAFHFPPSVLCMWSLSAWDSIIWTWQEPSIATLILRGLSFPQSQVGGKALLVTVPTSFPLPVQTTNWTKCGHWAMRSQYRVIKRWTVPIRFLISYDFQLWESILREPWFMVHWQTRWLSQLPYKRQRVESFRVLVSQAYEKAQTGKRRYEADKRYAE